MKIGFNVLPLQTGHKVRGIGLYTKNLLSELKKSREVQIVEFEDIEKVENVDLVHYPFFDLFFKSLPNKKKFPTVVTIHDVIPLIFSKYYPVGVKGWISLHLQKRALGNVKAVITDSVSSKEDIFKYLRVPEEKMYPVYLGVSDSFKIIRDEQKLDMLKQKYNLPETFALYIGNVNWNKNLLALAKACVNANTALVLIGSGLEERENLGHPELRSFKAFLKEYENNPLVKILGYISEDDLPVIINLSKMVLLPSFYEGFGLPILEAQACGVPVITSNVSSMPEVAGKGAILVDPSDRKEVEQAIMILLTNSTRREQLIKKGLQNVARFSWRKTADETIKVYKFALKV